MLNKNNLFMDAHLDLEPYPTVCYKTGLTVYEETLIDGIYISCGWNGSGYPFHVTTPVEATRLNPGKFSAPQAFCLGVDGQSLSSHWLWDGFEKSSEEKGLHVTVRLRHSLRSVDVTVHTLLDGSPVIARWIEIKNTGGSPAAVHELAPISGGLQDTKRWRAHLSGGSSLYSLGYMEDTHWGHEGNFQWHDLPNAGYEVYGRFRRDRHRHPMFVLRNNATGEHFICQFAWSGGYAFGFDLDLETDDSAPLALRIAMDSSAPLRMIAPNETISSPQVHIGMLLGGLDEAVQEMHDHLRMTVFKPQARGRGCWIEGGIGPEVEMSQEMTLRAIEDAAYLGLEVFFIDAGWYVPPKCENEWWARAGDWHEDKERYLQGLAYIREQVKQRGMLFGLWLDAERIGSMSRIYEAHPEWVITQYTGKPSNAYLLDLTNPDAAQWMESEIARVITEYELDFFRLDHNVGAADAIACIQNDGYIENSYMRYYEALYGIYDRLRVKFPDVIFENCAGGGGRTDVGMVSRFCHTWVTDWQIAPRSFSITNGMTMALPPEYVDRLISGQNGHIVGSLDFQMRLLMFVRPTVGSTFYPLGYEMNSQQMGFIRHCVELYKEFIRPFMPEGVIYHHTPVVDGKDPKGCGVLELSARDGSKGILGVFRLSDGSDETTVCLRGVDESALYKIAWDNKNVSAEVDGYRLAQEGIRIRLGAALTSELILYEKKN